MKINCSRQRNQAMTLFEVGVVIVIIAILAAVILPAIAPPQHRASRINCVVSLKQLGLAYKVWAEDNNDKYPMEISVTNGGTMELMSTPDAWKTYLVMSNELSTPKIIICPEDPIHHFNAVSNWGDYLKTNISYFIGLDASDTNSNLILAGDGNFLLNGSPANHGFVNAPTNASLTWDTTRHMTTTASLIKTTAGNIGLSDGSVISDSNAGLNINLQQTGFATNRFFVP